MLGLTAAAQERWPLGAGNRAEWNVYLENILPKSHSISLHFSCTARLDMFACGLIILFSAVFRLVSDVACLKPGEHGIALAGY